MTLSLRAKCRGLSEGQQPVASDFALLKGEDMAVGYTYPLMCRKWIGGICITASSSSSLLSKQGNHSTFVSSFPKVFDTILFSE